MKMFRTSNIEIVRNCQSYFGYKLPSELWSIRVEKFDVKYASYGGSFVNYGTNATQFFSNAFFCCLSLLSLFIAISLSGE